MAVARWFIARNKEKVGPFSAIDLKQLALAGLLQPGEFVWLDGASKWVAASSVPGLFAPAGEKNYWLTLAGQTRGPYVADQIRAGLNAHQFTLQTPARSAEDQAWTPLGQLPEFSNFKLETVPMTPSRAQLLTGSLEFEEAALYLAGKSGDALAKLIATFMDLKRKYANSSALVESLDATIAALQAKRAEGTTVKDRL